MRKRLTSGAARPRDEEEEPPCSWRLMNEDLMTRRPDQFEAEDGRQIMELELFLVLANLNLRANLNQLH